MKSLFAFLVFISFANTLTAQVYDFYTNEKYSVQTKVENVSIQTDYAPSDFEVYIDEIEDHQVSKKSVKKLQSIALNLLNDAVSFYKIESKINKKIDFINEQEISNQYGEKEQYLRPRFSRFNIQLNSIVNNFAFYSISFLFETTSSSYQKNKEIAVTNYYVADFSTGKVEKFDTELNLPTQKKVQKLLQNELEKIYLLATQKIDYKKENRILALQDSIFDPQKTPHRVDFSEAIVLPYASGVLIEFPEHSAAAKKYKTHSFRLFVNQHKLPKFLAAAPRFKKYFNSNLPKTTAEVSAKLLANNFDFNQFKSGPENLAILDIVDFEKDLHKMEIKNYQLSEGEKRFIGSTAYRFTENNQPLLIEHRNQQQKVVDEVKYQYTKNKLLKSIQKSGYTNQLELYFYNDDVLNYTETISVKTNRYANSSSEAAVEIRQKQHVFSGNNYYQFTINLLGEYSPSTIFRRSIDDDKICSNYNCLLVDSSNRVVGIQSKRSVGNSAEILTLEDGRIKESYFDSDRHHFYFSYNDRKQLQEIKHLEHGNLKKQTTYIYSEESNPRIEITHKNSSTTQHLYFFEF
ncbi:MAG: hypothetical protein ACQESK_02840 [Bacteroidota bacterium]